MCFNVVSATDAGGQLEWLSQPWRRSQSAPPGCSVKRFKPAGAIGNAIMQLLSFPLFRFQASHCFSCPLLPTHSGIAPPPPPCVCMLTCVRATDSASSCVSGIWSDDSLKEVLRKQQFLRSGVQISTGPLRPPPLPAANSRTRCAHGTWLICHSRCTHSMHLHYVVPRCRHISTHVARVHFCAHRSDRWAAQGGGVRGRTCGNAFG